MILKTSHVSPCLSPSFSVTRKNDLVQLDSFCRADIGGGATLRICEYVGRHCVREQTQVITLSNRDRQLIISVLATNPVLVNQMRQERLYPKRITSYPKIGQFRMCSKTSIMTNALMTSIMSRFIQKKSPTSIFTRKKKENTSTQCQKWGTIFQ